MSANLLCNSIFVFIKNLGKLGKQARGACRTKKLWRCQNCQERVCPDRLRVRWHSPLDVGGFCTNVLVFRRPSLCPFNLNFKLVPCWHLWPRLTCCIFNLHPLRTPSLAIMDRFPSTAQM